jgi:hypothetical protein
VCGLYLIPQRRESKPSEIILTAGRGNVKRGTICAGKFMRRSARSLWTVGLGLEILLFLGRSRCCRPFANNFQGYIFVFGAVVVNLLSKMGHEAACGHRNGAIGKEFCARAYPPSPGKYQDKPVVGVKVRMAHVMRMPFDQLDVLTWFRKISSNHGLTGAAGLVHPGDLIWQFKTESSWVEIGGFHSAEGDDRGNCKYQQPGAANIYESEHYFLHGGSEIQSQALRECNSNLRQIDFLRKLDQSPTAFLKSEKGTTPP